MKKEILALFILVNIIARVEMKCFAQARQENKIIKLFNGHNLDGWYSFLKIRGRNSDPNSVFTVSDGMIRVSGEEWGSIITNDKFENYSLLVEYKWGELTYAPRLENARDGGLLFHSQGEDGGFQQTWMHAIECQIMEGGTGDFVVVGDGSEDFQITSTVDPKKRGWGYDYRPDGEQKNILEGRINWLQRDPYWTDTLGYRGKNDVEKPIGEWNTLECRVENDEISIRLNGILINKVTNVKPNKGRIQIQSESSEIFFRRVDLELISDNLVFQE